MYSTFENVIESAKLAWKHKLLWIVALLAVGVYSTSFDLSDMADSEDKSKSPVPIKNESHYIQDSVPGTLPADIVSEEENEIDEHELPVLGAFSEKVLGAATKMPLGEGPPSSLIFGGLPDYALIIMALVLGLLPGVLLLVFFNTAIYFLMGSWARGAFFSNTIRACKNENYTFKTLGDDGRKYWKRYLKLMLYILGIRLLTILPLFILGLIIGVFFSMSEVVVLIGAILALIAFIWMLIFNVSLYFVEQYSYRLIPTKEMDTKSVYKAGWTYYKIRPGKSIKLFLALSLIPILFVFVLGLISTPVVLFMMATRPSYDVGALVAYPLVLAFLMSGVAAFFLPYLLTWGSFSWTKLFLFIHDSFDPGPDMATQILDSVYKPQEVQNG